MAKMPAKLKRLKIGAQVSFNRVIERAVDTHPVGRLVTERRFALYKKVPRQTGVYIGYRVQRDFTITEQYSPRAERVARRDETIKTYYVALVVVDPTRTPVAVPVNWLGEVEL